MLTKLYTTQIQESSPKTTPPPRHTLDTLKREIRYSGSPVSIRDLTIAALDARGPWPNSDGPATLILCVSTMGMMIEGGVSRRTVQRRIRRAVSLGFWRKTRDTNSWLPCPRCGRDRDAAQCPNPKCNYRGSSRNKGEFMRPNTYELDLDKFIKAPRCREIRSEQYRTYAEYKALGPGQAAPPRRPPIGEPTRSAGSQAASPPHPPGPPPPPRHPTPAPREETKPIERSHRNHISRQERQALFNAYLSLKASGMTHAKILSEVVRQFKNRFTADDVDFAMKIVSFATGEEDVLTSAPAPLPFEIHCGVCADKGLVLNLKNGPGEKRLIPCPRCNAEKNTTPET